MFFGGKTWTPNSNFTLHPKKKYKASLQVNSCSGYWSPLIGCLLLFNVHLLITCLRFTLKDVINCLWFTLRG